MSQLGGFQVSRRGSERGTKGNKGELARGAKSKGECAVYIVIYVHVHKECLRRLYDTSCVYMRNNNNRNECY